MGAGASSSKAGASAKATAEKVYALFTAGDIPGIIELVSFTCPLTRS